MMQTSNKAYQQSLKPSDILTLLKSGNERFVNNKSQDRDLNQQVELTSNGQFPFATILSCIDSRAPAELILDQGIGDVFNIRIAGNVVNEDILGSMEFSCKVAGSKLVLVLGHTDCGAIKGACNHVELGNLTQLIDKIVPVVEQQAANFEDTSGDNLEFVNDVAECNVKKSMETIQKQSDILNEMISNGEVMLVGAVYDVSTGVVKFMQ